LKPILLKDKNISILDAGAGTGACTRFLYENGYNNITAVDKSKDMIYKIDVDVIKKEADLHDLSLFSEHSFDIIICRNVLHYLKNIETVFSEFKRICKKDGLILVSQVISPSENLSDEYDYIINRNIHYPTKNEILKLVGNYKDVHEIIYKHNVNSWLLNTVDSERLRDRVIKKHQNTSDEYKKITNYHLIENGDIIVDSTHLYVYF
jgi:ubiquinone/menaquinone biosynthesis C-methylase UbiE